MGEFLSNVIMIIGGLVGLYFLVEFIAATWPLPWLEISNSKLARSFHGLILFGKSHSYISIEEKESGNSVRFIKAFDSNKDWRLFLTWTENIGIGYIESQLRPKIKMLEHSFALERSSDNTLVFSGTGLQDPDALEGLAKLIVSTLWSESGARFRVEFLGPKDNDAVNKYFGFGKYKNDS